MIKHILMGTFWALVFGATVWAQDTPSDVNDLVGSRAAGAETALKARGYKFVKTTKGGDRSYSNWWKASTKTCLTVATFDGHYDSIVSGPAEDCKISPDGAVAASGDGAPSDVADLVGAKAAGAETDLKSRGYRFVKTTKGGDRSYSNWWKASTKTCLTVATFDGRYDSIVTGPAEDCKTGGGSTSSAASQIDLSDLVGARGAGAETEMQSRGFRNVKGKKIGSTSYTYWKNDDTGQCVQVAVRNGNVASILRSNAKNCQ